MFRRKQQQQLGSMMSNQLTSLQDLASASNLSDTQKSNLANMFGSLRLALDQLRTQYSSTELNQTWDNLNDFLTSQTAINLFGAGTIESLNIDNIEAFIAENLDLFALYDMGEFDFNQLLSVPLTQTVQQVTQQLAISGVEAPISVNAAINLAAARDSVVALAEENNQTLSDMNLNDINNIAQQNGVQTNQLIALLANSDTFASVMDNIDTLASRQQVIGRVNQVLQAIDVMNAAGQNIGTEAIATPSFGSILSQAVTSLDTGLNFQNGQFTYTSGLSTIVVNEMTSAAQIKFTIDSTQYTLDLTNSNGITVLNASGDVVTQGQSSVNVDGVVINLNNQTGQFDIGGTNIGTAALEASQILKNHADSNDVLKVTLDGIKNLNGQTASVSNIQTEARRLLAFEMYLKDSSLTRENAIKQLDQNDAAFNQTEYDTFINDYFNGKALTEQNNNSTSYQQFLNTAFTYTEAFAFDSTRFMGRDMASILTDLQNVHGIDVQNIALNELLGLQLTEKDTSVGSYQDGVDIVDFDVKLTQDTLHASRYTLEVNGHQFVAEIVNDNLQVTDLTSGTVSVLGLSESREFNVDPKYSFKLGLSNNGVLTFTNTSLINDQIQNSILNLGNLLTPDFTTIIFEQAEVGTVERDVAEKILAYRNEFGDLSLEVLRSIFRQHAGQQTSQGQDLSFVDVLTIADSRITGPNSKLIAKLVNELENMGKNIDMLGLGFSDLMDLIVMSQDLVDNWFSDNQKNRDVYASKMREALKGHYNGDVKFQAYVALLDLMSYKDFRKEYGSLFVGESTTDSLSESNIVITAATEFDVNGDPIEIVQFTQIDSGISVIQQQISDDIYQLRIIDTATGQEIGVLEGGRIDAGDIGSIFSFNNGVFNNRTRFIYSD